MAFRTNPKQSNNQTPSLHVTNSVGNTDLVVTGAALTNAQPVHVALVDTAGSQITAIGSSTAVVNTGQQTTNTTAVQLSAVSTVPTNGIIVEALSSNSAESIFIGGSGVTTANGFEIQTGASVSFTCNLNTLYIISASSTTNKVCWNVV